MKQIRFKALCRILCVIAALTFVSCGGGNKNDSPKGVSSPLQCTGEGNGWVIHEQVITKDLDLAHTQGNFLVGAEKGESAGERWATKFLSFDDGRIEADGRLDLPLLKIDERVWVDSAKLLAWPEGKEKEESMPVVRVDVADRARLSELAPGNTWANGEDLELFEVPFQTFLNGEIIPIIKGSYENAERKTRVAVCRVDKGIFSIFFNRTTKKSYLKFAYKLRILVAH